MIQMKKLFIIIILIFSVIFISGCTSNEKTNSETSPDSQINQNLDTQSVDLIIKSKDVPGLTLSQNYKFLAVPKNTLYVYGDNGIDQKRYTNTLPIGYRNVGEESTWRDQSGRKVTVTLFKYDSNLELIELISNAEEYWDSTKEEWEVAGVETDVKFDFGELNIGDYSRYISSTDINTDIQGTTLTFFYKNNLVTVFVTDEKDKSLDEAIRIAKLVKSRLD